MAPGLAIAAVAVAHRAMPSPKFRGHGGRIGRRLRHDYFFFDSATASREYRDIMVLFFAAIPLSDDMIYSKPQFCDSRAACAGLVIIL